MSRAVAAGAAALALGLACGGAAAAKGVSAPQPGANCLTYDRQYESAPLMRVLPAPGGRVHLQDAARPCAAGARCAWVRAGYVVPGDVVVASAPRDGFRCVYAAGPGRVVAGFVPDAALAPDPNEGQVFAPGWLPGRWSDGSDLVVITRKGPGFVADGDGIWPGRGFAGPPGPHVGEFHASVSSDGGRIKMVDAECVVTARRRGPFLLFADNENCGGLNVRFMGLYAKGSHLKP